MRVIIPIGGIARRLLPLTAEVSKACIRLVNRPLIEISLLTLANQGVRNFIFGVKGCTNYRSLHDHFESGLGFSAKYSIQPRLHIKYQPNVEDYGSADSARINMEYYDIKEPVFAVQGDNIFEIDLGDFLDFHRSKGAFMTIGLMSVSDPTGFGIAEVDKNLSISRFVEKPSAEKAPSNLANTGLYLFSPELRQVFKEKKVQEMIQAKRLDFGYDLIPYIVDSGRSVCGYVLKGAWYDVGTPERYLEAMNGILGGRLRSLQDFGGRVSEVPAVWVQGESVESVRRREKIEVVYNGIDAEKYSPSRVGEDEALNVRKTLGIKDDEFMVLFVGRLDWVKGADTLLHSMPEIIGRVSKVKLLIVGVGPQQDMLRHDVSRLGLQDGVTLKYEFLSEEEKIKLYAAADVCVFPSKYEPFGIVCAEAMSMGKPVVVGARDVSGLREQVIPSGPNQCGFHINPYDPSDIAKFVVMLLEDDHLRRRCGENARRRVLDVFTWRKVAENTMKVYEETVS